MPPLALVTSPAAARLSLARYFIAEGPVDAGDLLVHDARRLGRGERGQTISKHANESGREVGWSVSIVDRLFADPCGPNETIDIGPTADDLAAALRALPGPDVAAPMEVTIGGRSWKVIEVTVSADVDVEQCDPPIGLQIWLDRSGNKYFLRGP